MNVRSKYATPLEVKELDELLISNKDEKIWEQKVSSKWVFVNLFNQLVFSGIFIFYFRDILNILISICFVLPAIFLVYISKTMKYSILPDKIKFEWGLLKRKKVLIPFSDITTINLVKYDDSNHSTIFFGTKNTYKIRKVNFDMNEPRAHITFENVKEGDKVMKLLNLIWQRNFSMIK